MCMRIYQFDYLLTFISPRTRSAFRFFCLKVPSSRINPKGKDLFKQSRAAKKWIRNSRRGLSREYKPYPHKETLATALLNVNAASPNKATTKT